MAKRRTYQEILLDELSELPPNKWYKCKPEPEYDKFVKAVKELIDAGHDFEFSNDYKKIRRAPGTWLWEPWHLMANLPAGVTVNKIDKGSSEYIKVKNQTIQVEIPAHYQIYRNGQLIAIENL